MAIYCVKCGASHECSVCPVCAGFGLSNLQVAAGVGKSFQPADELRAKFEAWCADHARNLSLRKGSERDYWYADTLQAWKLWQAAHASRDAEVEALRKDAERYRWLRNSDRIPESDYLDTHLVVADAGGEDVLWNNSLDVTIDAAMREGE